MTKKRKNRDYRKPTRKLHFERPYGIKLEDLMEIYMKVVGDMDVDLDMKVDKITFTLSANKLDLEKKATELQILQKQLLNATIPDDKGNFEYAQDLFPHIFKGQIQTKFLSDVVAGFEYHSEFTDEKSIISDVGIDELQKLQTLAHASLKLAPQNQNRDIQRFATIVNLRTGKSHDAILQLALVNGILDEKDGKLHFAKEKDEGLAELIELVGDFSVDSVEAQDFIEFEDSSTPSGFGFEGGKIVFVNANDDLERSTYEDEDREEKL